MHAPTNTLPGANDDLGYSHTFPRFLEKRFKSSAELASSFGLTASEAIRLIVPLFLDFVTSAGKRDWDNFHAYINRLPVGAVLKAVHHFSQLIECASRLGAEDHLLKLRECLMRIESERPEYLVKAGCTNLLNPVAIKTSIRDNAASDQLARRLDLRSPGHAQWLAADVVGIFDQNGVLSAVVSSDVSRAEVESHAPAPIDPREIDEAILWLEWGYPRTSDRVPPNFIHALYARVIDPLANGDESKRLDLLSRIFPEIPHDQRDALYRYLEATRNAHPLRPEFSPPDRSYLLAREDEQRIRQAAADWDRVSKVYGKEGQSEIRDRSGMDRCVVGEIDLTLPIQRLPARLRELALETRTVMRPAPRSPVETDRIPWTPRFFSAPDEHDNDLGDLIGFLPQVFPAIEQVLGLPVVDLTFQALCHLAAAFGAADPKEWRYIGAILGRHPSLMPVLSEVLCLFARNPSDLILLDRLTDQFDPPTIQSLLQPYRELVATASKLEEDILSCQYRTLLPSHRAAARRQVDFSLINSNRYLRKILEASVSEPSGIALQHSPNLIRGKVLRAAALELTADTTRLAESFAQTYVYPHHSHPLCFPRPTIALRAVPGHLLTSAHFEIISAIATLGLLEYPPEVARWLRVEFHDELDHLRNGTMHFLEADGEVAAMVHVALEGPHTAYGSRFYAHPEARRAGLAFPFLSEVIDYYVSQGLQFEAWMWEEHQSRDEYYNLGFEPLPELRRDDFFPEVRIGFDRLRLTVESRRAAGDPRRRRKFE